MDVLLESNGFRFVQKGIIELNGKPDYRLQERDYYNLKWYDVYKFDNQMQCLTAMEDIEYALIRVEDLDTNTIIKDFI